MGLIKATSFSRLMEFESCAYRSKLALVDRAPAPKDPNFDKYAIRGQTIHSQHEAYIKGESRELTEPLDRPHNRAELEVLRTLYEEGKCMVEEGWGFTTDWQPCGWMASDVWLRVKLDAAVVGGNGAYDIIDAKSGKKFNNEVKHGQQGILYGIAAAMKFSDLTEAHIRFNYVDQARSSWTSRRVARPVLMQLFPSWNRRLHAMTDATEFKARPSKITCRFCPFRPERSGGSGVCEYGVETP